MKNSSRRAVLASACLFALLVFSGCFCLNKTINFTLATEAAQVLHFEPEGIDRVKVIAVGPTPTIYYYAKNEPLQQGYPAEVRWILVWDKNLDPEFDEVEIVEKGMQADAASKGLVGGKRIERAARSGKSGRVRKLPEKPTLPWAYQVVVKRNGVTVGQLDPEIIIQKDKPRS